MIEVSLLLYALLLSLAAPRVLAGGWTVRHPGAGLLAWHVVVGTVITSAVAAALIAAHDLWKPIAALAFRADPTAEHLHVTTTAVSHEWDASLLVLVALAARLLFVTVRRVRLNRGERAQMRSAVAALSVPDPDRRPGEVTIIDLPEPTAFCIPGRPAADRPVARGPATTVPRPGRGRDRPRAGPPAPPPRNRGHLDLAAGRRLPPLGPGPLVCS